MNPTQMTPIVKAPRCVMPRACSPPGELPVLIRRPPQTTLCHLGHIAGVGGSPTSGVPKCETWAAIGWLRLTA